MNISKQNKNQQPQKRDDRFYSKLITTIRHVLHPTNRKPTKKPEVVRSFSLLQKIPVTLQFASLGKHRKQTTQPNTTNIQI